MYVEINAIKRGPLVKNCDGPYVVSYLEVIHLVHHSFIDDSTKHKIPGLQRAKLIEQRQHPKYCHFILSLNLNKHRVM